MKYLAPALYVIGTGSYSGFVVAELAGFPPGLLGCAIAGGIASVAILAAGLIWRERAKQKPEIIHVSDETLSKVIPIMVRYIKDGKLSQDVGPCTEAERRADLLAMAEGRMTLDDWLQRRWDRPSPSRLKGDAKFKEDVRIAVFKEIMRNPAYEAEQPACRRCLGIHETETCTVTPAVSDLSAFSKSFAEMMGVGKYVTVEELSGPQPKTISEYVTGEKLDTTMPPTIKPGDRVRGIYLLSSLYNRIGLVVEQLFDGKWGGKRAWRVSWGGSSHDLYEHDFILALPKKGEVWHVKRCENCDSKGSMGTQTPFNVDHDWIGSDHARERIDCGCLYRIGEQS